MLYNLATFPIIWCDKQVCDNPAQSKEVAWIVDQIRYHLKRCSKKDVLGGYYSEENRVVIVPRNKRSIPKGTLSSI